jgi:thiol-disulfide isomerase/thioredoxin
MRIYQSFLLVFFTTVSAVHAQKISDIIERLNEKSQSISPGYSDTHRIWKSSMKDDTTFKFGRTFFFKKRCFEFDDTVSQFILYEKDQLSEAFDGENYYSFNADKKEVFRQPVSAIGGVSRLLNGRSRPLLKKMLYCQRPLFNPTGYNNCIIDTIIMDREKYLLLTLDTLIDQGKKVGPQDSDKWLIKEVIKIRVSDWTLAGFERTVSGMFHSQYEAYIMSPYTILPDSITFDWMLHIDSLENAGWNMVDSGQRSGNLNSNPQIKAGDVFPNIPLLTLSGDTVNLNDIREGYLFLDFWYLACPYCIKMIPVLDQIYDQLNSHHFRFYGVNCIDKKNESIKQFNAYYGVNYPTLLDVDKKLCKRIGVTGFPTFILIHAPTQEVVFFSSGFNENLLERLINSMTARK